MELNIGDIVLLKSGSIPMTVIAVEGTSVTAQWYNEEMGTFSTENFVSAALEVIEEDDLFEDMDDEDENLFDDEDEESENEAD